MSHVLDLDGPRRLLTRPEVARVLSALADPEEETRLVGGCVRDALLRRDVSDIDLATTLLPDEVVARAATARLKTIPTGIAHGTVTVLADGHTFEVTTLREDIETDGRHAVVRFGRDFSRDAERRDFTINALSLSVDGSVADMTGGVADLAAGRVRFIGEAATRIREDALRILRFFRFHARYGAGAPDADGVSACIAARDALDGLSRERVRAELLKLLLAPGAVAAVGVLSETGLLARLIGGIGEIGRLEQAARGLTPTLSPWEKEPVAAGTEVVRLAALAVRVLEDADRLRLALRLSKTEHAALAAYAAALATMRSRASIEGAILRGLVAVHGVRAVSEVVTAVAGEPRPTMDRDALALLDAFRSGDAPVPVFPLAGADLVAEGMVPGPDIGARLAAARRRWLEQGCRDDDSAVQALMAYALSANP